MSFRCNVKVKDHNGEVVADSGFVDLYCGDVVEGEQKAKDFHSAAFDNTHTIEISKSQVF